MKTLYLNTDKWYKVVLVWELYRIPYNLYLALVGYLGITILQIEIPKLYLVVGVSFNILYTLLSPWDLLTKKRSGRDRSVKILMLYCIFCTFFVIGGPFLIVRMLGG